MVIECVLSYGYGVSLYRTTSKLRLIYSFSSSENIFGCNGQGGVFWSMCWQSTWSHWIKGFDAPNNPPTCLDFKRIWTSSLTMLHLNCRFFLLATTLPLHSDNNNDNCCYRIDLELYTITQPFTIFFTSDTVCYVNFLSYRSF